VSRSNLILRLKGSCKRKKTSKKGDESLLGHIKDVIQERPTYGYRRVTVIVKEKLKKLGVGCVNRKNIYQVMENNKLLLQKPNLKPTKSHTGKVQIVRSNTRWCSDTFTIQCLNGDQVHVAFSIDTCDREVMRYIASTIGIDKKVYRIKIKFSFRLSG
jgi:putative transposase